MLFRSGRSDPRTALTRSGLRAVSRNETHEGKGPRPSTKERGKVTSEGRDVRGPSYDAPLGIQRAQ